MGRFQLMNAVMMYLGAPSWVLMLACRPCERALGESSIAPAGRRALLDVVGSGLGGLQHPLQHVVAADKGVIGGTAQVCSYERK
jgi:hypothetical protein